MRSRVQHWLTCPDPFPLLRKSLKLRATNTGNWYLHGKQYKTLKTGGSAFAWLYGAAGSGKTILSAGVIDDLQDFCRDDPARSLAFYFFDFHDAEKQNPDSMLKNLISQFLERCPSNPKALLSAYEACGPGIRQPSNEQLLVSLKAILQRLPHSFIVLDALDECSAREALFEVLEQIASWSLPSLRVILTSRREVDIEDALETLVPTDHRTCLESAVVDNDIRTYVRERLSTDKTIARWRKDPELQTEIETTLGTMASGMCV